MPPEFALPDDSASRAPWMDAVVRPVESRDIPRCASLIGAHEGWPQERAEAVAAAWMMPGTPKPLVLVAERGGTVHGFGRADLLDPSSGGGRAPRAWYLTGLLVAPESRRRGLGAQLTQGRLDQLAGLTEEVWYFTNAHNLVSIALHERLGFRLHTEEFAIPGVAFEGGRGALFRRALLDSR